MPQTDAISGPPGLEIYSDAEAERLTLRSLNLGYRHLFASVLAGNQRGVGKALAKTKIPRKEIFLTGSVTACQSSMSEKECYTYSRRVALTNLKDLGQTYLDQIILDNPPDYSCSAEVCPLIRAQWQVLEEMYHAAHTRSIGVSNFCPECFRCLQSRQRVAAQAAPHLTPHLNQMNYHIGMGVNPNRFLDMDRKLGIISQAYSPLGHGSPAIVNGKTLKAIGATVGGGKAKTAAQVALRWLLQHGVAVCLSTTNPQHFVEDLEIFDFVLDKDAMGRLDALAQPAATPAACYH